MKLETYFDFLAEDDIRFHGTRIGIESVLYEYVYQEKSAKVIASEYPSLSLESVYAAILYFLQNRSAMEAYLVNWLTFAQEAREEQKQNPPAVVRRLQKLKAEKANLVAVSS